MSDKTPENSTDKLDQLFNKLDQLIDAIGQYDGLAEDVILAVKNTAPKDMELIKLLATGEDRQAQDRLRILIDQIRQGQAKLKSLIAAFGRDERIAEDELETITNAATVDTEILMLLASGQDQQAQERLKAIREEIQRKLGKVFAVAVMEDGTEEPITFSKLKTLIDQAMDEDPDREATETLKILLGSMLEYANTQQALLNDPVASRTLGAMRTIFEYLQQDIQGIDAVEEFDKFLKQQTGFMAIPRPAGIEALLSINAGKAGKEITIKEFDNARITFEGRLGIDEQKINDMVMLAFASNNPHGAKTNLNTIVELPFTETMEILKRKQTARNKKAFADQLRKEILPTIAHQHLDIKMRDGSFKTVEVGGGEFYVNRRKDKIGIKLSNPFAVHINTGNMSQYSSKAFRVGSRDKPLAYYLTRKLQDHYFMDGNRKRGANTNLAIKTLLRFCSDTLPSYEYVQQTDRGHWVRQIRQPLEDALNEIQSAGLFKWEYCKKGLAEATPQEIRTNDYRKWSRLYITFTLIPEEPDQTDRLEHKQARIEAAQAKKALKDAQTLVKADQIEQRKKRKAKKKKNGSTA